MLCIERTVIRANINVIGIVLVIVSHGPGNQVVTIWSIVCALRVIALLPTFCLETIFVLSKLQIHGSGHAWEDKKWTLGTFPQRNLFSSTAKKRLLHFKQSAITGQCSEWLASGHLTAAAPPGAGPPQACSRPSSDLIWSNSAIQGERLEKLSDGDSSFVCSWARPLISLTILMSQTNDKDPVCQCQLWKLTDKLWAVQNMFLSNLFLQFQNK